MIQNICKKLSALKHLISIIIFKYAIIKHILIDIVLCFTRYKTAPSIEFPTAGYWTAAGTNKVIKPHNKRFSKVNVPIQPKAATVTLDAAKRKQLPAWIREGNFLI